MRPSGTDGGTVRAGPLVPSSTSTSAGADGGRTARSTLACSCVAWRAEGRSRRYRPDTRPSAETLGRRAGLRPRRTRRRHRLDGRRPPEEDVRVGDAQPLPRAAQLVLPVDEHGRQPRRGCSTTTTSPSPCRPRRSRSSSSTTRTQPAPSSTDLLRGEGRHGGGRGRRGRQVWHGNFFPDVDPVGSEMLRSSPRARGPAAMGRGASSSSPAARAIPSCGKRVRRRSSFTGTRRVASCRRTAGSTSTSTSAGPTGATSRYPPNQFMGMSEKVTDRGRDQIE